MREISTYGSYLMAHKLWVVLFRKIHDRYLLRQSPGSNRRSIFVGLESINFINDLSRFTQAVDYDHRLRISRAFIQNNVWNYWPRFLKIQAVTLVIDYNEYNLPCMLASILVYIDRLWLDLQKPEPNWFWLFHHLTLNSVKSKADN